MKTKALVLMICLGSLSECACAGVTLFGVMDASVRVVHNTGVGTAVSEASGGNQTSRFGLIDLEDLGGGWQAGMWLESQILVNNGVAGQATPPNQLFDRRSTVSLMNKRLGELRFGRDFIPTYDNWMKADPFGNVGLASSLNLNNFAVPGPLKVAFGSVPNVIYRSSNSMQYLLPKGIGGIEGEVMYSPGQGGNAASGNARYMGMRLGYAIDGLWVSASRAVTNNSLTGPSHLTDSVVAATYQIGGAKIHAGYRHYSVGQAGQTNVLVGLTYSSGVNAFKASIARASYQGHVGSTAIGDNSFIQIALGYVYSLSKRTALYVNLARITNHSPSVAVSLPGGGAGLVAGGSSTGGEVGLRTYF